MKCRSCDKELKDGAKFCPHCGVEQAAGRRGGEASPPASSDQPTVLITRPIAMPPEPVPDAAPPPPPPAQAQPPVEPSARIGAATGRRSIGIALIAIAAIGGLGYWGWTKKLEPDATALRTEQDRARAAAQETAPPLQPRSAEPEAAGDGKTAAVQAPEPSRAAEPARSPVQPPPRARAQAPRAPPQERAAGPSTAIEPPRAPSPPPPSVVQSAPPPPSKPASVKESCADRPNFVSRGLCESRLCKTPEWVTTPYCVDLNGMEKPRYER